MSDYTTTDQVRRYTGLTPADVSDTELGHMITDASEEVDRLCGNPRVITHEIHKADGKRYAYRIGDPAEPPKTIKNVLRLVLRSEDSGEGYSTVEYKPHYPIDPDAWTDSVSDWSATDASLTHDTTYFKNGTGSVKIAVSAALTGVASFPTTQDVGVDIDDWSYLFFNYRVSTTNPITIRLCHDASNYREYTLTPTYTSSWQTTFIDVSDDAATTGNPTTLNYLQFQVVGSAVIYVDGIILNDGYGIQNPSGDHGYVVFQSLPTSFAIDYSYDPFTPTPTDVALATANLVGQYAFEYLSGYRMKETAGNVRLEDMEPIRDDFRGLAGQAYRFRQSALRILERRGFDYDTLFEGDETLI